MDYDYIYSNMMYLKKNPNHLSLSERTKRLIKEISDYPDAYEIYKGLFLNSYQIKNLQALGINAKDASRFILNQCEIRTSNSTELTYQYYGFVKTITPALLNQVIDDVTNRIQLENEYAKTAHVQSLQDEKEDELTMNELSLGQ